MEINKYIIGNNLEILKTLPDESFQMVYLDPPFATGRDFDDYVDKFDSLTKYGEFLYDRFIEIKRILKKDGVIIVHGEPSSHHYVRLYLDKSFGEKNFCNEIIWKSGGNKKSTKKLARFHDNISVYSKTKTYKYNPIYEEYGDEYRKKSNIKFCPIHKKEYTTSAAHNSQPNVVKRPNLRYEWKGNDRQWYLEKSKMIQLDNDNRLEYNANNIPRIKRFLDEMSGIPIRDLWTDITSLQSNEKIDYATQKPVKLLERIITLYSDENDLILDPFAGSGSLGRAAINKNRNYILIDINEKGKNLFEKSIEK